MAAIFKTLFSVVVMIALVFTYYYYSIKIMHPEIIGDKLTEEAATTTMVLFSMFGIYYQWNWFYKRFK